MIGTRALLAAIGFALVVGDGAAVLRVCHLDHDPFRRPASRRPAGIASVQRAVSG